MTYRPAELSTEKSRPITEEEFRAFFEVAGVGQAMVDVQTRRFVRVNRRFEELTGYTAAELREKTFGDITHPDDRLRNETRFHELMSGQHEKVRLEKRYVRKDGSLVVVNLTTTMIRGPDGRPRLQVGVVSDITAQREAQDKLAALRRHLEALVKERTAELEEKSAQLESFVYTVAHDLRAPLRAIDGYAEFVTEDRATALTAASLGHLERIKKAARRMDGLIRDLLSYTRVAQVDLRVENVPLAEAVERALVVLYDEIARRGAEVAVASPLPVVLAERSALEQIITHLVANALKFVAPGAQPCVEIHAQERDGLVRFMVTDHGIGIAQEYQGRVFRMFERLESARNYPGTGIGLPIVAKTVERLGGSVGLESVLGSGSTFWFELKKGAQ